MKILVAYGTNSGSTRYASEHIKDVLEKDSHEVDLMEVWEVGIDDLSSYNLVLFGTNTWFYDGKEGQPHRWYLDRADEFSNHDFKDVKCAIFALGDSSYAQFCASADVLHDIIQDSKAEVLGPHLRMDGFYRDEASNKKKIHEWLGNILG